ncbi:hypothetical protein lbkm_2454 [Lachnospiraceae bacterium KM106-2]|nr:hypothetical protein lbkm_2454 [Lachnospiraceae bacterium KM106-2]
MKIACNVIHDLLPLYVEKITSEESNALIDEHIATCEKCRKEMEKLNSTDSIIAFDSVEPVPLELIKKSVGSRKKLAVSFVSCIVFLVTFTIFAYLIRPNYIPYEKSGVTVEKNEKNEIYAQFSDKVTAYKLNRYQSENGKNIVEIEAWTSIWDKMLGKASPYILVASPETKVSTVYYCENSENTDGDNMKIVYGENPYPNGGVITLPRMVLGYYFLFACIATILLGGLWIILRNNNKANKVCKSLFFLPVSYMLSTILLQNGFVSFSAIYGFITNVIATIVIYAICMIGSIIYRQYREDRSV